MGHLNIRIQPHQNQSGTATIEIHPRSNTREQFVTLNGINLTQPRPGWIAVELPAAEHWEPQLRRLDQATRARVESPEFYQLIQRELSSRFLKMLS